jgi:hypothetical protein
LNIIDRSAIDALRRMDEVRKAREDRMRNALEILAGDDWVRNPIESLHWRFVQRVAREGLGREAE